MARVTIEDCETIVSNRFELVLLAAQRARQISSGNPILVERDNDKDTVVALREIADGKVAPTAMSESIVKSFQKFVPVPAEEEKSESVTEETMESIAPTPLEAVVAESASSSMFEEMSADELVD